MSQGDNLEGKREIELAQYHIHWQAFLLVMPNMWVLLTVSYDEKLTLSCVRIPTMRDDKNPPRDDRVFAIPNIVPAKAKTQSNCPSLILSKQYLGTKYTHIDVSCL